MDDKVEIDKSITRVECSPYVRSEMKKIGRFMNKVDNDTALALASRIMAVVIAERVKREHWSMVVDDLGELTKVSLASFETVH